MAAERLAELLQLLPQRFKIVDFPVEGDDVAAAGGMHRLMTHRRKIDDRETAMSERDSGVRIYPHTFVLGTAVTQAGRHASRDQRELFTGFAAGSV